MKSQWLPIFIALVMPTTSNAVTAVVAMCMQDSVLISVEEKSVWFVNGGYVDSEDKATEVTFTLHTTGEEAGNYLIEGKRRGEKFALHARVKAGKIVDLGSDDSYVHCREVSLGALP